MNGPLLLAWRHLTHHRTRTLLLALSTALAFFLPIAVERLVTQYGGRLRARAAATPLLIGAKGSRYDLALASLYFRGRVPDPLPNGFTDTVQDSGLALAIPLALGRTAQGYPLVGTSLDYFEFRRLEPAAGTMPQILGDAVLGANVAAELGIGVGDSVLSDKGNVYDLSLAYPLKMRVVGVLAAAGTPDDGAIFVDTKTAWIVDGIGHGHESAAKQGPNQVLEKQGENVALNASLVEFVEITPENIASFHFHGDPATFPLSSLLAVPNDAKSSTLLKGRFRVEKDAQILVPQEAIEEILGFVFQLKKFFDLNVVLVAIAMACFLALVVLLSLKVRERELETLKKLGCARGTAALMVVWELLITLGLGFTLAMLLALAAVEGFARFVLSL